MTIQTSDEQFEMFPTGKTLREARNEMQQKLREGTICPCCDRYIKIYKRRIHKNIAVGLIEFCKYQTLNKSTWVRLRTLADSSPTFYRYCGDGKMDITTGRYWGLLEESGEEPNADTKSAGMYRLTEKGISFVRNEIKISKYAFILRDTVMDMSEEMVSIVDCLEEKFSYSELMNS